MRVIEGGEDGAFTLTESDGVAVTLADSTESNRISVNEELALFTVGERNGLLTLPAEFEHRSELGFLSSRDGTGTEHISGGEVASSDSVVSDSLGDRVVQVLHVALSDHVVVSHGGSLDVDLEVDVVRAQVSIIEVIEHLRLLSGEGNLERLEGFRADDPGGDSASEVLGVEGAEGDILPDLQVTSRPVVEQSVSEHVVLSVLNFNGMSHFVSLSDDSAHLKFEI